MSRSMSKAQNDRRYKVEKKLVAAIRDKMDALAHAQFLKDRDGKSKNPSHKYSHLSSADRARIRRSKIQYLRNEIHLILCANGFTPHVRDSRIPKATVAENLAIRFDFDGIIHRPESGQLSDPYRSAKQAYLETIQQEGAVSEPEYPFKSYCLSTSPVWQGLSRFANFRRLNSKIIAQLQKKRIPPSAVQTMNYYDFVDAISESCKESRARPFEGARSKNLKMFASCYGDEFFRIMTSLRYEASAVHKMLRQMRNGTTPEIIDLHHKTNVTNFRELEKPEEINLFPNMLLTFIHPHHRSLHFDKGYDIDKNLVFFGGYDPLFQIRRDPEKERQYLLKTGQLAKNAKTR